MYFEGVSYSDQGVSFAVEWVAALIWACTWAVIIEEMDVSNGPESGRNLAAILEPQTASLCHFATFSLIRFGLNISARRVYFQLNAVVYLSIKKAQ